MKIAKGRILAGVLSVALLLGGYSFPGEAATTGRNKDYRIPELQTEASGEDNLTDEEVSRFPVVYDEKEMGRVTAVKNQGSNGMCWAFAAIACMENNAILHGYATKELDLSEAQLAYSFYNNPTIPLPGLEGDGVMYLHNEIPWYSLGGNNALTLALLPRGAGPVMEEEAPYGEVAKELPEQTGFYTRAFGIKGIYTCSGADRDGIKEAILSYGGVTIPVHLERAEAYTAENASQFTSSPEAVADHEVCVVGWDDNYPKENFGDVMPVENGAWLCKNSYGEQWGQEGYFWLSYEDSVANSEKSVCYAFDLTREKDGTDIYQHDGGGSARWQSIRAGANVFTARTTELLRSVSVTNRYAKTSAKVLVYTDCTDRDPQSGRLVCEQRVAFAQAGYSTAELDKPVLLAKGQRFSVCVVYDEVTSVGIDTDVSYPEISVAFDVTARRGESFFYTEQEGNWTDLTADGKDRNLRIKATAQPIESQEELMRPKLTVMEAAGDTIRLKWNDHEEGERYYLYCAKEEEDFSFVGEVSNDKNIYTYAGAETGKSYRFYLMSVAEGFAPAYSNEVKATVILQAPEELSLTQKDGQVTLRWNKVKAALQYVIYRKTKNGSYRKLAVTGNIRMFVDDTVKKDAVYYYRIKAKKDNILSEFSAAKRIKVQ